MQVLSSRVLLRPHNFQTSVEFYEQRLGLVRYRDWDGGVVYFLGGGFLELSHASNGEPEPVSGVRLWLQVADAAAACAELTARDVTVDAPPERKPWGLIEASIHDPDGLEIVIIETPTDHPLRRR